MPSAANKRGRRGGAWMTPQGIARPVPVHNAIPCFVSVEERGYRQFNQPFEERIGQ